MDQIHQNAPVAGPSPYDLVQDLLMQATLEDQPWPQYQLPVAQATHSALGSKHPSPGNSPKKKPGMSGWENFLETFPGQCPKLSQEKGYLGNVENVAGALNTLNHFPGFSGRSPDKF